jgi:glycosyltransferase involved in cell wall biosynthesis
MRAHNVEHEIWERVVQHTRFIPKRMYLQLLVDRLKRYEINQLKQYDLLAAISARDLSRFMAMGYANPAIVTPIGISMNAYKPDFKSYHRELSVGFIGSLDWIPNVEGVQWFLMDVWGEISNQFSKLTLQIAGRNPPRWISDMKVNNIQVLGEVPDAAQFMNQHAILVVPLLSGSGMRAKILEAMALGKIVITTSIGLEGIPARDKKEVLIANTTEEFLEALHFCHQQNGQLEQMGKKAIEFVRDHFEYQEIGRQLMAKYSALQPATEQV